jgi:acetyl esterase
MTSTGSPILPGRLGTPTMVLNEDPRADPRLIAALAQIGVGGPAVELPFDHEAPLDVLLQYCTAAEEGFGQMGGMMAAASPPVLGVKKSVEVIRGLDGNDITLLIHQPENSTGAVPGVLHIHGGGMVILQADSDGYDRWRNELAATGMVVVGVEFRNGGGKLGPNPFPAGLNDCTSALKWIGENKARLGISKLIVSGESGGGNLTIATTLQAKKQGNLNLIDGVYAQCPYISGMYATKTPLLPSLYENDEYFLDCKQMGIMTKVYDPTCENATNPLAWPYHAATEDLVGLPPHVISVNQLDPLRDEGLAYFAKLLGAGVPAVSRTVNGTSHAADCIFRDAMPDVYLTTIRDIKSFADSL